MALNTRRVERSKKASENSGGGNFLKMKEGKNLIRIFSFNHTAEQADFDRGLYKKSDGIKVGEEFDEIEREVYVHFTEDGVQNCIRKDCEICEKSKELMDSDDKGDQKLGKNLKANKRFYVNCVDIDDVEKGVQICPLPSTVFNMILEYVMDPEYGEEILGCKGRDFIIDRDKEQEPSKMYTVRLRDNDKCQDLDEGLQDDVKDLFKLSMLEPGWTSDKDKKGGKGGRDEGKPKSREEAPKPRGRGKDDEDDAPPAREEAPKSRAREKEAPKAKEDDENPFPPDGSDADSAPSDRSGRTREKEKPKAKQEDEIPAWVKKGVEAEFDGKKGPEVGIVKEINVDDKIIVVETDTSEWDLNYDEVRKVKRSSKPKARR